MARPIKQGLDYFPHDVDAVSDEKIAGMRALYGNDGYAFFLILLERIYRDNDGELDISTDDKLRIQAKNVGVTVKKFAKMLQTSLEFGLFSQEIYKKRKKLTSNGIKKRLASINQKRETERERYQTRKVSAAETQQKLGRNAAETPQVKESKVKNSKAGDNRPPPVSCYEHLRPAAKYIHDRIPSEQSFDEDFIIGQLNQFCPNKTTEEIIEAVDLIHDSGQEYKPCILSIR